MIKTDTRELVLQHPVETASMHSRGRNGGLTVTRIELHTRRADSPPDQSYVSLWAYSRRSGEYPPIMLTVSLEDAVVLAEQLLEAVRAVLPIDKPVETPERAILSAIVEAARREVIVAGTHKRSEGQALIARAEEVLKGGVCAWLPRCQL